MNEHYFSTTSQAAKVEQTRIVTIQNHDFTVTTMPGVFSHDGLDKGTAVLFRKVPITTLPADAKVLDLGCGWGPISLALAQNYPTAEIFAADVNERAIDLCKRNLLSAGISCTVDFESALYDFFVDSGMKLDLIWSNPPIRIGKAELHELLLRWLALLSSSGVAYFVVQKNLGADSLLIWLNEQGF
ncbi:class I SAM-dependent methyltransferase [Arcanobacterium hippocoleae]